MFIFYYHTCHFIDLFEVVTTDEVDLLKFHTHTKIQEKRLNDDITISFKVFSLRKSWKILKVAFRLKVLKSR